VADAIHVGQRFGQLTVVRLVRDSFGDIAERAFVRCDCGREDIPRVHHLLNGNATSCDICGSRVLQQRRRDRLKRRVYGPGG
jgi:DNA-directed RNA polymerase subunit RPC12/RpoP